MPNNAEFPLGNSIPLFLFQNKMAMNNIHFPESELILNADGSIFHLHLLPEQVADRVILVGDPGRVELVASHFEHREFEVESREFRTVTGTYKGKRITVVSTGIGCDNIDIVVNELDALANIDFNTRTERPEFRQLHLVRVGTCGGLQRHTPEGTFIASQKSLGFDGLLNFYDGRNEVCDLEFERAFLEAMAGTDMVRGVTIACGGFYGPQGRRLRVPLADPQANDKIMAFKHGDLCITNFEMESSALAGLARLMGHKAMTCCMVVANRVAGKANPNYKNSIDTLITTVLDRI